MTTAGGHRGFLCRMHPLPPGGTEGAKAGLSLLSPGWGLGKDGGSSHTSESQGTRGHLLRCLLLTEAGTGAHREEWSSRLFQGEMRVSTGPSMEPARRGWALWSEAVGGNRKDEGVKWGRPGAEKCPCHGDDQSRFAQSK